MSDCVWNIKTGEFQDETGKSTLIKPFQNQGKIIRALLQNEAVNKKTLIEGLGLEQDKKSAENMLFSTICKLNKKLGSRLVFHDGEKYILVKKVNVI